MMGRTVLWGAGALAIVACASIAIEPANSQSLNQSIENALAGNCAGLPGPRGPQLNALCTSIPAFSSVSAPNGGNPQDL
jgi:hypothetical protein